MDAKFEQEIASVRDGLPRVWWGLCVGCLQAGFSKDQALALTQSFILSQCPAGIRPSTPDGPDPTKES
jgi:hypothetical protein